jgi:UDP-3-O-[3-hydroxymyristoyl] glucosamine N-acyltransferase
MPDPRFFEDLGPITIGDLVALTGAAPVGVVDLATVIGQVAPLEHADPRSASFFADRRYLSDLAGTAAGACFLPPAEAEQAPPGCARLATPTPQAAYASAAARLHRPRRIGAGAAAIDPSAELEEAVVVGHGVVIGANVKIGRGAEIGSNTVIGPGVSIGRGCVIGANVTIGFALIGDNVRILSGVVIGEAGFGIGVGKTGAIDLPQLGRVILQDGVTVGANTCIDRGAYDDTVVGENTKIDNQVQIGHNVRIGRDCVLCGHTGLSGSTIVGDRVMFGAKAGIADHITIGDGAQVMAAAGVMHDIPAGEIWGGAPAVRARQFWRQVTWLSRAAGTRGAKRGDHDQTQS